MTPLQAITYRGQTVAVCSAERFVLTDALAARRPGDPEVTFIVFMCAYALDIAAGVLPGPYNDTEARRYAHACLIPHELLERADLDVARTAAALGVPPHELHAAQREYRSPAE